MNQATQGRRIADSATEMIQPVLPHQANVHGTVLGGTVMHWIDMAAAVVANRHSRRPVVTAAIDEMSFLAPITVGQLALLKARLTMVDRSSMEIRVVVESGGPAERRATPHRHRLRDVRGARPGDEATHAGAAAPARDRRRAGGARARAGAAAAPARASPIA